ncbi:MAG TPA: ABC transporter ATP-binding protein [Acetobacteraceae bacterium]|nr:ABC transporter ATP-binding protein [Acetobacteraceae bacterium]
MLSRVDIAAGDAPVGADAPTGPPFVAFADLTVEYGTGDAAVRALERVNLAFGRGDFVCIVGPSGCGKTTMLQTLAGFIHPGSGTVSLNGRPIAGPGPDRGVVFQQPALFPWMTVAENAGFGPRMRGANARTRAAAVESYLRTVGLWEFRNRYPYELSGGMQQRLAIVRALANDPELLLMDEPFGALDALTRERMQEELHSVWRRTGMTVVFITHSVEEAVYLGTDVVVMSPRPGRIVEHLKMGFCRQPEGRDIRAIKSSAEFVAARERVLGLIWRMEV